MHPHPFLSAPLCATTEAEPALSDDDADTKRMLVSNDVFSCGIVIGYLATGQRHLFDVTGNGDLSSVQVRCCACRGWSHTAHACMRAAH